jgi:hypothetical protein
VDATAMKLSVDQVGNRALSTAAEAGEPDNATSVPGQFLAISTGHIVIVPSDVSFGHVCFLGSVSSSEG